SFRAVRAAGCAWCLENIGWMLGLMAAITLEAGRKVSLFYQPEPLPAPPPKWHERVLLEPGSEMAMQKCTGESLYNGGMVWWVLTPDGDVYPEELAAPPLEGIAYYDDAEVPHLQLQVRPLPPPVAANAHGFRADRSAGPPTPLLVMRAISDARVEQHALDPEAGAVREGPPPAPAAGRVIWVIGSSADGDPEAEKEYTHVPGDITIGLGAYWLVKRGAKCLILQEVLRQDTGMIKLLRDQETDARVIPVKWRSAQQRGRNFREAVSLQEFHDFGDSPLQGEVSLPWLLTEVAQSSEGMVTRHHTWLSASGIPSGDRSIHEHFVISKVFDLAIELDQLNTMTLTSFELLGRRLQLIEQAHVYNPSNPDYSNSDDFMGWGVQRGAALVAPSIKRRAGDAARDRAAVLKEGRKLEEEIRLRGVMTSSQDPVAPLETPAAGFKYEKGSRLPVQVPRDLFPLPELEVEHLQDHSVSRSVQRRVLKRSAVGAEVNRTIKALNALDGHLTPSSSPPSLCQREAIQFIRSVHDAAEPPQGDYGSEGAVRALLGTDSAYGGESTLVQSYDRNLLSIPHVGAEPVPVKEMLPPKVRCCLEDLNNILLDDQEWGAVCERADPIELYMDPKLRYSKKAYFQFVRDCHSAGLIRWAPLVRGRVTVFCVAKKTGKQRLVVDCRATNRRFRRCPYLPMGTGSSWGEILLEDDADLWVSLSDIKDYFYACGIDDDLSSYFCLDDVPGWLVSELEGNDSRFSQFYGRDAVAPAFRVLPMGFSWSFYLAQIVHSSVVKGVLPDTAGLVLQDRRPGPTIGARGLVSLPYCDNHATGAGSPELADGARIAVARQLTADGFAVHEEEDASLWAESLGFAIDGLTGEVGPTAKRATRLAAAGRWLARRPRITGVMLERFLGHCAFQLMGERSLLSIFGACYRFVRVHYKQKVRLWQSAARECEWLSALVRFARTNLRRPWSPTAHMFDSSETGLGIVQGVFDEKLIAGTGQYNERWRFKQPHALARGVRAGALWHFRDVIENVETVLPIAPPTPRPWKRRRGFPEVPTKMLEKDSWHTILSKPWFRDEHITLLEARTGRLVCKSLGRSVGNRNKKHLILGDSMGSILAFSKGRLPAPPEGVLSVVTVSTSSSRSAAPPVAGLLQPPRDHPSAQRSRRLREDRAKVRRARHAVPAGGVTPGPLLLKRDPHQLSILEQASVQPQQAATYRATYAEFAKWAANEGISLHSDEDVDAAAVDYLGAIYLQGYEASSGDKLLGALKFMRSGGPRPLALPLTRMRRALRGFRKAAPGASRFGLPWEWTAAIAGTLLATKRRDAALCLLTAHDTYSRPGEITDLQVGDVVLPTPRLRGYHRLCPVMRPEERGQPRKTGSFDDTVSVEDLHAHISSHLVQLAKGRDPSEKLFRLSISQYKEAFENAADLVGLAAEQLCTYQVRHGGASRDAMLRRRDLSEIQKRGGWKTFNSVRRYEKFGKVQQAMNRTPSDTLTYSRLAVQYLDEWLHG
ncbi:unnamed protein product, partial [Prorocentrum cordatum]